MNLEYIQARILMSLHAFVHHDHRLGWIGAGECFRLVQLLRLHELDDTQQVGQPNQYGDSNWIHVEERRRAFWMSYCMDILVSKRGDWPLTLHEHVVTFCDSSMLSAFLSVSNQLLERNTIAYARRKLPK